MDDKSRIDILTQPLPKTIIKVREKGIEENPIFFQKTKSRYAVTFTKGSRHKKGGNFYFGLFSLVLFGFLFFSSPGLAKLNSFGSTISLGSAIKDTSLTDSDSLFFNSTEGSSRETPDLKNSQDGFVYGVAPSHVVSTQTYAAIMGGAAQIEERTEIIDDYTVEAGETLDSLAIKFGISKKTIALANDISANSSLKAGQKLIILPVDGILYEVKKADTLEQIAKTYKVTVENIIAFNHMEDTRVYIGDSLILKDAVMPVRVAPAPIQIVLPNTFFIFPVLHGLITQGLHPTNAIDVANSCGTAIYAAAGGIVQRAGYDRIGGNRVTISHSNGTVTYYGHLQNILVKPGDQVTTGDRLGSMGRTGKATGCHLHFQVFGAKNPLSRYSVGSTIDVKNLK